MSERRSWWRTNRWWLPTVPLTLAMMLAAQSYRVEDFWWLADSHRSLATGEIGDPVAVRDPGEDALGGFTREFSVTLVGVEDAERYVPEDFSDVPRVPDGARAVEVELAFEADPDQVLAGCRLALVDEEGVRYGGGLSDPLGQLDPCVPDSRPGPLPAFSADQETREVSGKPRPGSWSVTWTAIVPEDAVLSRVRLSFDPPEYVDLVVPPSS